MNFFSTHDETFYLTAGLALLVAVRDGGQPGKVEGLDGAPDQGQDCEGPHAQIGQQSFSATPLPVPCHRFPRR